jgi:hypothetical protein
MSELVSVPAVGRIYGRCAPGARTWTLAFVAAPGATDKLQYRIGHVRRTVQLNPGESATLRMRPGTARKAEPADKLSGQAAATVKTATPVHLIVEQGTEPHIYRVDAALSVAAAVGDTAECALISSSVNATTYYPGGAPPG